MSIFHTSFFLLLIQVLNNTAKAPCDICAMNGEGAVAERTAPDFDLKLKSILRSGRPFEFDEGSLIQI